MSQNLISIGIVVFFALFFSISLILLSVRDNRNIDHAWNICHNDASKVEYAALHIAGNGVLALNLKLIDGPILFCGIGNRAAACANALRKHGIFIREPGFL